MLFKVSNLVGFEQLGKFKCCCFIWVKLYVKLTCNIELRTTIWHVFDFVLKTRLDLQPDFRPYCNKYDAQFVSNDFPVILNIYFLSGQ